MMIVRSLRAQLVTAFLLASLVPLAATTWIAAALIDRSLGYARTDRLDTLSRALESTVRTLYQRERDALKADASAGIAAPHVYLATETYEWPEVVRSFWERAEPEQFAVSGTDGDRVDYFRRDRDGVRVFSRDLHGIRMTDLTAQLVAARAEVSAIAQRDLRRGFTLTLLLLLGAAWALSLVPLLYIAHRISRPVRQLTEGLSRFAADGEPRALAAADDNEVGHAVLAFNTMATQLHESRARLVHLTQMASWQSLARKTAHELKNSLTPIRLTVEEMLARQPPEVDRTFMARATAIVVAEIESIERRVRAFSDFATEPAVRFEATDVNALVSERIALIEPAYPSTTFECVPAPAVGSIRTDADLVKGTLTNLLQNAAEAAGASGRVRVTTHREPSAVIVEVHDSGPGLGEVANATLFEPTISFKPGGMGLGLSIARRNALACGGDLTPIAGVLGGAAFRVTLPADT